MKMVDIGRKCPARFLTSLSAIDSLSICENPRMLFMGVRNSWFRFNNKEDFIREDSSAFSLAIVKSASACLRLMISITVPVILSSSRYALRMILIELFFFCFQYKIIVGKPF